MVVIELPVFRSVNSNFRSIGTASGVVSRQWPAGAVCRRRTRPRFRRHMHSWPRRVNIRGREQDSVGRRRRFILGLCNVHPRRAQQGGAYEGGGDHGRNARREGGPNDVPHLFGSRSVRATTSRGAADVPPPMTTPIPVSLLTFPPLMVTPGARTRTRPSTPVVSSLVVTEEPP